ncbi:YihY/virulence factor BrkB family protein [Candidatus Thiothrix sp. Deng01]|uniref:YihY/virulence factor BrkB family protein n=1 Tax=Candidatus Thiothrix phosphatis TaxID=3112415 RepID=A0ABU6D4N4_9GAMM|nr:YihY/virulence factor BrkB family protein [Candidatus Thiothrix sp. Deng01]MEB4593272.1 YihY/virulence factor BrkB family protein [Candidatus Thiothrix sp. Deng01]
MTQDFFHKYSPFLRALPNALLHDILRGEITLRAMSLVYTTLLSLAPLLALSFSVLKGFGVHNQMEPILFSLLAPLGAKAGEFTQQILGFVDNIRVGVLGVTGLAILLYTVVSLMQKIENAFNHIWRVKRPRSLAAQFRDYLSVVMVGPVLMFSALGVWTSLQDIALVQAITQVEPFGSLLAMLLKLLPVVLVVLAFTFLYLFMPNTRVQPRAALGGALVAGVVWQVAGWLFASFVVSFGQQTAIYSIFASLFLFMLWLYVGWVIVLTGARLAYYFQYPDAVRLNQQPEETSVQARELLAVSILREIGQRFLDKRAPPTLDELRKVIPVSRFLLEDSLQDLISYGVLCRDDNEPPHYLLQVSPTTLTVADIRQHFWQGTAEQQQQARDIQRQTGLDGQWLEEVALNPHWTVQALLEKHLGASSKT